MGTGLQTGGNSTYLGRYLQGKVSLSDPLLPVAPQLEVGLESSFLFPAGVCADKMAAALSSKCPACSGPVRFRRQFLSLTTSKPLALEKYFHRGKPLKR